MLMNPVYGVRQSLTYMLMNPVYGVRQSLTYMLETGRSTRLR